MVRRTSLSAIAKATRLFTFHDGAYEYTVLGIPGFVGALSGIVPGKYSVTLNQAPASERPGFDMGAAFLVREVLTECRTFRSAVYSLTRTPLSSPVLFTICGTEPDEACVIERLKQEYAIRKARAGEPLVVTNHHVVDGWDELDDDEDSIERYALARKVLRRPRRTLRGLVEQLERFPIHSNITVQRMAFNPRHGKMLVVKA